MENTDLCNIVSDCTNKILEEMLFSWPISGGWERWFQMELFIYLTNRNYKVYTEQHPVVSVLGLFAEDTSQFVDMYVREDNFLGKEDKDRFINNYIEIKCMSMNRLVPTFHNKNILLICAFLQSVLTDWQKQLKRVANKRFSLVLIPTFDCEIATKASVDTLISIAKDCEVKFYSNLRLINAKDHLSGYMYVCTFELDNQNEARIQTSIFNIRNKYKDTLEKAIKRDLPFTGSL